ncbi:hypothetical protein DF185_00455 [Marinifilum breve]|uniref:histidine kinase n=1 Tax=Marinifilum breve TaxID=2184082 RepID=A0A2V4A1I4_9BACT|nr:tetratricopeptide repeat-containing sensor histidine kinase [Marinifilum breve]PXY02599.1 hypothetical protein DF185_00455 [Marinifilum breve]
MRLQSIYKIALLCLSVAVNSVSIAQQSEQEVIDSLKNINEQLKNNKELVDNYNRIALAYGAINIDSSLLYSEKGKLLAKELQYWNGLATSHSYYARASIQTSNLKAAIENFHIALDLFKQANDSINILDTYRGLSYVSSYGSSQLKTLSYNLEALKYAESLRDTASLSILYNNIGTVYKKLNNYESALKYFNKSLAIDISKNIPRDLAIGYSNIGILKVEHQKHEDASNEYNTLIQLIPKIESKYIKSYLHTSLATYHLAKDNLDTCQYHIQKAYDYCIKNNYPHIKARVDKKQAELLLKKKDYKRSIKLFQESLDSYQKLGLQEEFPSIYKMQAKAYSKLGLYSKAYHASRMENQFIDSLQRSKVNSFMDEFEEQNRQDEIERFELEQALKDQQIENAQIQIKNRTNIALTGISLLIIIIGIIIFYYRKTNQKNQQLRESEDELRRMNASKDKFFSIISHDLKSPFNAIVGFSNELSVSYDDYNEEQRKRMIGIIKETSDSALNLLDNLLTWARSQSGFIQFTPEKLQLSSIVQESISAYLGAAQMKNIAINNFVDDNSFIYADKETIQIVISNLFNNAIKYNNENGEINISSKLIDDELEICIADNGIGMDDKIQKALFYIGTNVQRPGTSNEKGTGLGLILCKEFVNKNGGQIRVESKVNKGSSFYFTLPIT